MLQLPAYSDPVESHADWLEYQALLQPGQLTSWISHQRDLLIGGTTDEAGSVDRAAEAIERLMEDVVAELSDRQSHCGGKDYYPFMLESGGISFKSVTQGPSYVFQLVLTLLGERAGVERGERLFEDLCAEALYYYIGGDRGADRTAFGFPRRVLPPGFRDAVSALCGRMGEGQSAQDDAPETSDQKDAYLDIVAWKDFPDRRPGKLIIFGQCATGQDWKRKYRDLQPSKWCSLWLNRMPTVTPVPAFFVPRRIERSYWRRATSYGGIVFDRCRLAALTLELPEDLSRRLHRWIAETVTGS